jgi:hypothetical protein
MKLAHSVTEPIVVRILLMLKIILIGCDTFLTGLDNLIQSINTLWARAFVVTYLTTIAASYRPLVITIFIYNVCHIISVVRVQV